MKYTVVDSFGTMIFSSNDFEEAKELASKLSVRRGAHFVEYTPERYNPRDYLAMFVNGDRVPEAALAIMDSVNKENQVE